MQSRVFHPLVEVFLLLEQPRQRLSHWTRALAPLDAADAPPIAIVNAYYDAGPDQALFGLRYDESSLGPERLGFLVEVALLAEIGMIQPAELSEGDRRRFLGERLSRCKIQVSEQRKVVAALTELVRRVREAKAKQTQPPALRQPILPSVLPSRPHANVDPRGDTEDPILLVPTAKGTRDHVPLPKSTRDLAQGSGTLSPVPNQDATVAGHKRVVTEPLPLIAPTPPRTTSPNVIPRLSVHRADTVQMSPQETQRILTEASAIRARGTDPENAAVETAGRQEQRTTPGLPVATEATPQGIIYARYLRSGRWVPIRIGALSLKGTTLMAGALPRVEDHVDIALSYSSHRALVRGAVAKVSSADEAQLSGASSFTVNFELDDVARRQLTNLLTAARAANVMIKPPPPRSTRRFPVEWPICLGTIKGAVRAEALDVSDGGMFVRPLHALEVDSHVTFSIVLDDGGAPISGRSRVIRQITETDARAAGLSQGYGVSIVDMPASDRDRWSTFVRRIALRTEKRILVGAAPARLAELQASLAAAGYAVTGGTDPNAVLQLATHARPVDAALFDQAWLTPDVSPSYIESLFASRNVPCVMLQGDARRARAAVDKLLAVV